MINELIKQKILESIEWKEGSFGKFWLFITVPKELHFEGFTNTLDEPEICRLTFIPKDTFRLTKGDVVE